MRINIIFLLVLLTGFMPRLHAQEKYVPLPPHLDGSMMPFDFSTLTRQYMPDSLQVVYASYVARHGARYLSSPRKLQPVMDVLLDARKKGTLSDKGEAFYQLMKEVKKANEGNWGDLSPIGYKEERLLADRLYDIVTPLKQGASRVNALSSYMPRCVMTMYLTCNGVIRHNDSLMVMTDEGHQYDRLVCCFMADEDFARFRNDGDWRGIYDDFVERNVSIQPARSLFSTTVMPDKELRKLTMDMYEVLKSNRAAGLPAPTTRWMSVQEYENCWEASNLQHYLRNTITPISSAAAQATMPLLEDIISKIDRAVRMYNPQPALDGYFGHAETLLPLLSLIKVPGCFELPLEYGKLDNSWKIQNITPLGANLLILVSRGPSGRHYVSMQLNGRGVRPMPGRPEYVAWDELREYWQNLMRGY